jgi:hypothetical protein
MSLYSVINPYPVILSQTGTGLNGGKVYIGMPNQDPETFPQTVYWDEAGTIPAAQPLATIGGYITRAGSPAEVFVAGEYSVRVRDRFNVQVLEAPDSLSFIGQLASSSGAGFIGFSQTAAYPASTLGKKGQQFLSPLDAPWSAAGNLGTDDTAALAAADAFAFANGQPLFITKGHLIGSDITLQSDLIFIGGSFAPTSGKTVTIRGEVSGASQRLFSGAGSVVGIRRVRPEWFGALGNGTTDDSDALNACNTCVLASNTSRGSGRPGILYEDVIYGLGKTHRITPTTDVNIGMFGAGGVFGTRFRALTAWSNANGIMLIHVDCVSGSVTTDYKLESFTGDRAAGSTCAVGLYLGPTVAGRAINSLQACEVTNVSMIDFPVCWQFNQIRQIRTPGCSAWCENTAGAVGIKLTVADGTFTGDIDFEDFQITGAVATAGTNIQIENGTGVIRGLRFKSVISYHANIHVNIIVNGDGTKASGDIWFDDGCQFDGFSNNIFNVVVGAGSVFNDFWIEGVQARGVNPNGNFFTSTADPTSQCSNWKLNHNDLIDMQCGSRPVYEFHGSYADIEVTHGSFTNISSTTAYIVFYDAASILTIAHNKAFKTGTRQAAGWVVLGATTDRYTVLGNMGSGGLFTGTIVTELNGAATKYVPAGSNF